ncbi:MAG: class I SAM-dependent methyltransferase [Opitutaceae bacterium]
MNSLGTLAADHWEDYEILQTGDGMKKERWGGIILVRPDPQVIWPLAARSWGHYDGLYQRQPTGGGQWDFRKRLPEHWTVRYRTLTFKIRPTNFKHTGLFPEQAVNWDWAAQRIRNHSGPFRLLNLFGYTGAASVAAAEAGASVTHVDAAKGMVQWCRENAALSGLEDAPIRYLVDDCLKFVEREKRRGSVYEGIVMDPPSFGRGKGGEIWKLEDDLWSLIQRTVPLLSDQASFFLLNTYTTGLSATILGNLLAMNLAPRKGSISVGELGLPITDGGITLPCGTIGRWESPGSLQS